MCAVFSKRNTARAFTFHWCHGPQSRQVLQEEDALVLLDSTWIARRRKEINKLEVFSWRLCQRSVSSHSALQLLLLWLHSMTVHDIQPEGAIINNHRTGDKFERANHHQNPPFSHLLCRGIHFPIDDLLPLLIQNLCGEARRRRLKVELPSVCWSYLVHTWLNSVTTAGKLFQNSVNTNGGS